MITDTNAVSAFANGDLQVLRVLKQVNQLAIPVVVLGEYRFGIAQSRKRLEYGLWLQETLPRCRVLDIVQETTVWYADIRNELKRAGSRFHLMTSGSPPFVVSTDFRSYPGTSTSTRSPVFNASPGRNASFPSHDSQGFP